MARDLEVEARLTLKDDLSKKAGTALDAVSKKARNAGKTSVWCSDRYYSELS